MRLETNKEWIVVEHHTNGYREYRIPCMLAVEDALLLACEARADADGVDLGDWSPSNILVFRMERDGEAKQVLSVGECFDPGKTEIRAYHNAMFIPDEDQIHMIYHKNMRQAFIITSKDGGRTWSEARDITKTFDNLPLEWNLSATGPGHGIRMKNGRLVAPIWLVNSKRYIGGCEEEKLLSGHPALAGCIYSDDRGVTWQHGWIADTKLAPESDETCVVELPDGRLLFNLRNESYLKRRLLLISEDGGETFTEEWMCDELPDPICCGSMVMNGEEILFVNCDSEEERINMAVKRSFDGGRHWETIWNVDSMGGYPDIAVWDNEVYVFYERTSVEGRWGMLIKDLVLKKAMLSDPANG